MRRLAALALLDGAVIVAGVTGTAPAWAAALLHGVATIAALRPAAAGPAPIAMLAAAALGPIAALPALVAARWWHRPRPRPIRQDRRGPTPGQAADRRLTDRIADDRLHSPEADQIVPFTAVMRHGDIALRQQVVTTVVRNFDPRLSGLIAMALIDPDQSIRTQAAAAVAEIDQDLARTRARLAARPDRRAAWDLSGLLVTHVTHNRLLSAANRATMRDAAIALLERLAARLNADDPEQPAIARRRAGLLLLAGRAAEAAAALLPIVDPRDRDARGLATLIDALVALRDHDRLAAIAEAAAARAEPLDPGLAARIAYWRRPCAA